MAAEQYRQEETPHLPGRILALDLGEKRIGVAVSDETRTIARSHSVVTRTSRDSDFTQLRDIVESEGVTQLLVGLPVRLDGTEGDLASWVRDYAADLAQSLDLPYELVDESFTTQQASASMRARGKRARQQRGWVDAVAAAILLQDYLDAHYL